MHPESYWFLLCRPRIRLITTLSTQNRFVSNFCGPESDWFLLCGSRSISPAEASMVVSCTPHWFNVCMRPNVGGCFVFPVEAYKVDLRTEMTPQFGTGVCEKKFATLERVCCYLPRPPSISMLAASSRECAGLRKKVRFLRVLAGGMSNLEIGGHRGGHET